MKLPIRPVVLPDDLKGETNGKLSKNLLRAVPGGQLHYLAAAAWLALIDAAAKAKVELAPTSSADTYRTYEVQLKTFKARYDTTKRLSKPRAFEGKLHWLKPGKAAAAVPGTSNHGWGLAVDVANIGSHKLEWLTAHAHEFGWSWELPTEPWHLRYIAGDRVPEMVQEYLKKPRSAKVTVVRPIANKTTAGKFAPEKA